MEAVRRNISGSEEPGMENLVQLVGFRIGKELFGVNILMVQEIIRMAPITPVPNAPDFVEGVINLRGNIIPVIDLRKRLGLGAPAPGNVSGNRILIVNVDDKTTGFIVDAVSRVMKIPETEIKPPPDIVLSGLHSQFIRGVCRVDEALLIFLDFNRILRMEELSKLKQMGTA